MDPRLNPHLPRSTGPPPMQDIRPTRPTAPAKQPALAHEAKPANPIVIQSVEAAPAPAATTPPPAAPVLTAPTPSPPPAVHAPLPTTAMDPRDIADPIRAEVVEAIPLKQQEAAAHLPQPAPVPATTPTANPVSQPEDDLERILQAVNNRVKAAPVAPVKKSLVAKVPQKITASAGKLKKLPRGPKPLVAICVTILVAGALVFTAFYAYHQGAKAKINSQPGKVGTAATASQAIQQAGGTLVVPSDLDDFSQQLTSKLNSLNDSQDFSATPLSDKMLGL